MDEASKYHTAQSGWEPFLFRCWWSVHRLALRLLWSFTNSKPVHFGGAWNIRLVCNSHKLRVVHGGPHSQRVLLHRRSSWWFDVHPRHILFPRTSKEDQHLDWRHHYFPLPRSSDCRLHYRRPQLAHCVLGEHSSLRPLLAPRDTAHGRNNIQPQHPHIPATDPQIAPPPPCRHRAMALSSQSPNFYPGDNAASSRHLQASRPSLHDLLFPQLRLDHWRQRHYLYLVDLNLQVHPLQLRHVLFRAHYRIPPWHRHRTLATRRCGQNVYASSRWPHHPRSSLAYHLARIANYGGECPCSWLRVTTYLACHRHCHLHGYASRWNHDRYGGAECVSA